MLQIPDLSSILIPLMLHYSCCPNVLPNSLPIMIMSYTCKIQPDHYKISISEGQIQLHSVVQDYLWSGVLVIMWLRMRRKLSVLVEMSGEIELFGSWSWRKVSWIGCGPFGDFQGLWVRIGIYLMVGVEVSVPYSLFPFSNSIFLSSLPQNPLSTSILSGFYWCIWLYRVTCL